MLEWVAILLQEIFPSQGLNPSLPHCRRILYHLSYQGSPSIYIHMSNESGVEVARLESLVGVSRSCMGKPISQLFSRIQLLLQSLADLPSYQKLYTKLTLISIHIVCILLYIPLLPNTTHIPYLMFIYSVFCKVCFVSCVEGLNSRLQPF